jgi:hypothetical protein
VLALVEPDCRRGDPAGRMGRLVRPTGAAAGGGLAQLAMLEAVCQACSAQGQGLEIVKNGLPPLQGPGYNLRLPSAEEIAETHEHE